MSVYSMRAGAAEGTAEAYTKAVLDLLGDEDPRAVLCSTVAWCTELTQHLSGDQLAIPEAPEKWSVAAVLQHLADSELVWGYRLRMVLSEDRPTLTGYDQDMWAAQLGYADANREEALSLFSALRTANLNLLERVSSNDLDRVGLYNDQDEQSVRNMMRMYAGHDLAHRKQLHRLVDRFA